MMGLPSCRQVAEHASDYHEGQLTGRRRWLVMMHVLMCRHCMRYYRQIKLTIQSLRFWRHRQPDEHTKAALKQRFQEFHQQRGTGDSPTDGAG